VEGILAPGQAVINGILASSTGSPLQTGSSVSSVQGAIGVR
jgi:uncharacterized membrane protein YdcZ (DUF606 family)